LYGRPFRQGVRSVDVERRKDCRVLLLGYVSARMGRAIGRACRKADAAPLPPLAADQLVPAGWGRGISQPCRADPGPDAKRRDRGQAKACSSAGLRCTAGRGSVFDGGHARVRYIHIWEGARAGALSRRAAGFSAPGLTLTLYNWMQMRRVSTSRTLCSERRARQIGMLTGHDKEILTVGVSGDGR